jgi:type I restriction enzyme S subunit
MIPNKRFLGFKGPWSALCISDLGIILSGGTPKTSVAEYWDGDILWATPTDITKNSVKSIDSTERTISDTGLKSSSAKLVPAKSLLICSRATVGEMAINRVPMSTNQGFKNIIPDIRFDVDFLYYLLSTKKNDMLRRSAGSTFLEISKREIEKIKVNTPSLEEQRKIAACLSTWDKAIDAYDRLISLKEKHLTATLREMVDSSAQEFETPLSLLCDIKTGKKDVNESNPKGQYPFFSCAKKHTYSDTYSFDCEAILIAGNGEVGFSQYYKGKFDAYQRTYVLHAFKNVNPLFLFYYIKLNFETYCISQKQHSAMSYIKLGTLKDYQVPLPNLANQQKIVSVISTLVKILDTTRKKRDLLKKQKQGLMQQLLE